MLQRISTILLFLLINQTVYGEPTSQVVSEIRANVQQIRAGMAVSVAGQTISSSVVLPALYEHSNYMPIWTSPQVTRQLIDALEQIERDGLDSNDYHLPVIMELEENHPDHDPSIAAGFDLLKTDSLIRLGYHLLAGKVDIEALDTNWNMTTTIGDLDTVLSLADAIEMVQIPQLIDQLRPNHPYYESLRQGLRQYRAIREQGGWPSIPAGSTLKPGMIDFRVPVIRERLIVSGELAAEHSVSEVYDDTLTEAVKRFQHHHALTTDGVIGPATLAAMNVSVESRIDQIKVNLERARWVLHELPEKVLVTDIAGFEASYRRGGQIIWKTKAQVGKPYRKTPVFRDKIRYLEINPTWTVPPTILRKDILPKLVKEPNYLQQMDMVLLTQDGKQVDSSTIDWSQYPQKPFPYLLRQNPGPNNALGRIKFMFPNKHAVYLHDTPSRYLFELDQRAFSSGCIRVMHPFKLAQLLLDDPQWTEESIEDVVKSKQTTRINLPKPVTVILMYWTVNTTDNGKLIFKKDIYDRDHEVLAGLNKPFTFRETPILDD